MARTHQYQCTLSLPTTVEVALKATRPEQQDARDHIIAELTRAQVATLRPRLQELRDSGVVTGWTLTWPVVSVKGPAKRAAEAVQAMRTWPEFSQVLDLNDLGKGELDSDFGL